MSVQDDQTLGQLVAGASRDLSVLVRGELELAKAELKQSAITAAKGSGMFAVAAVFALLSVPLLTIALAYGLVALGVVPWLAFLIVAVFLLLVAGGLVFIGIRQMKRIKAPERTIASLEETKAMLQRAPSGTEPPGESKAVGAARTGGAA